MNNFEDTPPDFDNIINNILSNALSIIIENNIYRVGSEKYFEYFTQIKKQYTTDMSNLSEFDQELLQSDIGEFGIFENEHVPLDCPLLEKDENIKLNKPKRGGPKKYYVYVQNPKTDKIIKVNFGDTSGLNAKINNKDARKSFAARHDCKNKKDKTKPSYWSCRLPYFATQLGLSGGGKFFW